MNQTGVTLWTQPLPRRTPGRRLATVGLDLPLSGPLDLGFRIAGDTPALQLNDIRLVAGTNRALVIKAVGSLDFGDWAQADPLKDIDSGNRRLQPYHRSAGENLPVVAHCRSWVHLRRMPGFAPFRENTGWMIFRCAR